jgi:hypothetical protein
MVFPEPMISATFKARLTNELPLGLWFAERVLIGIIGAMMLAPFVTCSANAANDFELKISGYFNLTPGGALHGASDQTGSSVGVVPEGEIELTPQYHLDGGTILAARAAINTNANVGQSFQTGDLLIPEVSAFVIGKYGRLEVGERAAFPQSLVGFTPSEIAFTAAEFGPESGARLDPDGRLPPTFLQSDLASRIVALSYLGYSERFYDVRSPKLIYISPRIQGLYAALSYCPRTIRPEGFQVLTRQRHLARRATHSLTRRIQVPSTIWYKRPSCTTYVRRT